MRTLRRALFALLVVLWILLAPLTGRSQGELEQVLDGFDDGVAPAGPIRPAEAASDRPWRLSGDVYVSGTVSYAHDAPNGREADVRGLSRLRAGSHLALDLEWKGLEARIGGAGFRDLVYPIKKRDEFTHAVLQTYEADLEFSELWIRASPIPQMDVTVGRQIVVWGRSDTLRVVDVLNPVDDREPGLAELADLRLPVTMSRVDYYLGKLAFTGLAIHEFRPNKETAPGSDFFPPGVVLPGIDRPGNAGPDTEWGLAVSGRFQGWDASLHWARFYEDRPRFDPRTGLLAFSRLTMIGATGNYALGNWLLKGEVARKQDLRFFNVPDRRFTRSDGLVGLEYSGFRDTSVAIEVAARHIHGFEKALETTPDFEEETRLETSLRYTARFRNDALRVTLLAVLFGEWGRDGGGYRATFDYELREGLIAQLGVAVYQDGDATLFDLYDDNDRVLFGLRQSF